MPERASLSVPPPSSDQESAAWLETAGGHAALGLYHLKQQEEIKTEIEMLSTCNQSKTTKLLFTFLHNPPRGKQ